VPTVRSVVGQGEILTVKILALAQQPVKSVTVQLRSMGEGSWRTVEASHQDRAVWLVKLPAAAEDFEYSVEAETADAKILRWPVTAPEINQTVVVN
jgi:hypothetical protein